jgi:hypothetical protein
MRKLISGLVFLMLLISCGSDPETTTTPLNIDSGAVQTDVDFVDPDSELVQTDESFSQILSGFPKHWIKVDVKKEGIVFNKLCEMESPSLKIEKVENHWEIITGYGESSESWHIINMTANLNTFNEQELQEGIFVVEKLTFPDNEIYEVKYFWNRTAEFCTFGDFFSADSKFAEFSKMDEFEVVKEKCD